MRTSPQKKSAKSQSLLSIIYGGLQSGRIRSTAAAIVLASTSMALPPKTGPHGHTGQNGNLAKNSIKSSGRL